MTNSPICRQPSRNPDDWFIGRDGRQYSDDEFLSETEKQGIVRSVLRIAGETDEEHARRSEAAVNAAESGRRRVALARRRHAKEDCWECPVREACLAQALETPTPATSGTWGGFYEEELAAIRVKQAARRRRAV